MKIELSYGGQRWQCPKCKGRFQRVRHTGCMEEAQKRISKCHTCGFLAEITTEIVPVTNYETKITKIQEAK